MSDCLLSYAFELMICLLVLSAAVPVSLETIERHIYVIRAHKVMKEPPACRCARFVAHYI